jgi:hypothetical protein
MPYGGYAKHGALIQNGAQMGVEKIIYDATLAVSGRAWVKMPDPALQTHAHRGVDVGHRHLALAADVLERTAFYGRASAS